MISMGDELNYVCNLKGKPGNPGSRGPPGGPPQLIEGYWYTYDDTNTRLINTGVKAQGPRGDPGKTPIISKNNTWELYDNELEDYVDTGKIAIAIDGHDAWSPKIINGYWGFYDDEIEDYVKSDYPLNTSPFINEDTGNWCFFDYTSLSFIDSGTHAKGDKGDPGHDAWSPKIKDDFWYIYDDIVEDYIKSKYQLNTAPFINENTGNWCYFDYNTLSFQDTGIHAKGDKGERAVIPEMEFEMDGNGDLYLLTESVPVVDFELDENGDLYAIIGDAYG